MADVVARLGTRFYDGMDREALERLSKEELITLVVALSAQVAALTKRVAELETKLAQPPVTV